MFNQKKMDSAHTVMVAMSGGVDSSAAALILLEKGYHVIGVTMCLGIKCESTSSSPSCCGPEAVGDARRVCGNLGIKHYVLDFSHELENMIIQPFIREYTQGRTPNPCIWCNQFLKFGKLLSIARSANCRFLATGHYARIEEREGAYLLLKPKDVKKDQTYFLYRIERDLLPNVIFPLSDLKKEDVREKVRKAGLHVHHKPQSQDICFIPKGDYRSLISSRMNALESGEIVDKSGKVLGKHKGVFFYTIGQRKGLGIPGSHPWYVLAIQPEKNRVVVGRREELQSRGLCAGKVNFLVDALPSKAWVKLRSSHREVSSQVSFDGEKLEVLFDRNQEFVTPGQSVVLYEDNVVLGGGIIEEAVP